MTLTWCLSGVRSSGGAERTDRGREVPRHWAEEIPGRETCWRSGCSDEQIKINRKPPNSRPKFCCTDHWFLVIICTPHARVPFRLTAGPPPRTHSPCRTRVRKKRYDAPANYNIPSVPGSPHAAFLSPYTLTSFHRARSTLFAAFSTSFVASDLPSSPDILVVPSSNARSSNSCSASHLVPPTLNRLVLRHPSISDSSVMYVDVYQLWNEVAAEEDASSMVSVTSSGPRSNSHCQLLLMNKQIVVR
jgi:hypothetical protein